MGVFLYFFSLLFFCLYIPIMLPTNTNSHPIPGVHDHHDLQRPGGPAPDGRQLLLWLQPHVRFWKTADWETRRDRRGLHLPLPLDIFVRGCGNLLPWYAPPPPPFSIFLLLLHIQASDSPTTFCAWLPTSSAPLGARSSLSLAFCLQDVYALSTDRNVEVHRFLFVDSNVAQGEKAVVQIKFTPEATPQ